MAWFDDPDAPQGGWCCQKGQDPAPFDSPYSLPADILWISNWVGDPGNAPFPPHVCPEQFLGVTLSELAAQWDLLGPATEPATRVAVLAELAWRMVGLVCRHYRASISPGGMLYLIRAALARTVGPVEPSSDPRVTQALSQAYLLEHVREIDPDYSTVPVEFRFPAAGYAQALLRMPGPTPQARFQRYKGLIERGYDKEPGPQGRVYRFLCGLAARFPILVELDWSCTSRLLAPLMGTYSRRRVRAWFPGEEATQLAAYGRVAIRQILFTEHYQPLGAGPLALPREGEVAESVPSYGVLARLHYEALASPTAGDGTPVDPNAPGLSPHAVWVAALGRLFCLQAALAFEEAGLRVSRYGLGRLTVQVPRDNPGACTAVAGRFGLEGIVR